MVLSTQSNKRWNTRSISWSSWREDTILWHCAGGNRNGSAYVDTFIRSRFKTSTKEGGAYQQRESAPKILSLSSTLIGAERKSETPTIMMSRQRARFCRDPVLFVVCKAFAYRKDQSQGKNSTTARSDPLANQQQTTNNGRTPVGFYHAFAGLGDSPTARSG